LNRNGVACHIDEVITTTMKMRKAEVLHQLGWNVLVSIDDYVREVEDYKRVFPQGHHVMVSTPINLHLMDVAEEKWTHELTDLEHPASCYVLKHEVLAHLSSFQKQASVLQQHPDQSQQHIN
jgi:hypothetical protein